MSLKDVPLQTIPYSRKADSWDDPSIPTITSQAALLALAGLEVFPAPSDPLVTFYGARAQYFIVERRNGQRFLIDTQGYNYCRYVARIPLKQLPNSSGAELAGACEGEQIADLINLALDVANEQPMAPLRQRALDLILEIKRRAKE